MGLTADETLKKPHPGKRLQSLPRSPSLVLGREHRPRSCSSDSSPPLPNPEHLFLRVHIPAGPLRSSSPTAQLSKAPKLWALQASPSRPLPLVPRPPLTPQPQALGSTTSISFRFHSRADSPGSLNRLPGAPPGRGPSATPGSIPDSLLTLGSRRPPSYPLLSLSSRSPPRSESGSPDPPPSRRPSRRRSPGPCPPRRSAAPQAAGAEPGAGSRSGGGGGGGCAQASSRPPSPPRRQLLTAEPELLREARPYRPGTGFYRQGAGPTLEKTRGSRWARLENREAAAGEPEGACVMPRAKARARRRSSRL
ncbi:uncharacterized protein [Macaca fascicularis]|uniref:uncharacterized protein n=1 Tax=Macaca fascicularis TaxID=9541 RepID=UPI0032B07F74